MDKIHLKVEEWKNSRINVFWGEIAPCDHLIQFYDNDEIFLNTLEGFVGCGLLSGDSIILIATKEHLLKLNERLTGQNFDTESLINSGQLLPIDASEALKAFMVDGWPDEIMFDKYISELINRAAKDDRRVRAFGEMVALLWQQGLNGATVRLEHLWNRLHEKKKFSLYCAYPKNGFTQGAEHSLNSICAAHSKVIDGNFRPSTEIYYRSVNNL